MRSSLPQLELDSPARLAASSAGSSVATLPSRQAHNHGKLVYLHFINAQNRPPAMLNIPSTLLSTVPRFPGSTYHPFNPHSTAV
jgi:hypothetical protein